MSKCEVSQRQKVLFTNTYIPLLACTLTCAYLSPVSSQPHAYPRFGNASTLPRKCAIAPGAKYGHWPKTWTVLHKVDSMPKYGSEVDQS